MNMGDKVRTARVKQGLTQQQVADYLNVHRSTVSNYEKGKRVPDFKDLQRLAKVLNVSIEYFAEKNTITAISDFTSRATTLFTDANVSQSDKDKIFQDVMKLYLKSKEQ